MTTAVATQEENLPVTTYERIDPDTAARWLENHNKHNRPLSKLHVKTLATDLSEHRWRVTHQGVAFDWNGDLVDGQHRLQAIVESGVPATLQVTRNVDPKVFEVIDQHRKRTAGQILAMEGITRDAPRFAAMARALLMARFGRSRVTQTEAVEFALTNREHFEKFLAVSRKFTPAAGAAFALASMWGWKIAEPAAERLLSLTFTGETDPMKALYKASESQFPRLGQGDTGLKERFAITMNCLAAVAEGRGMKVTRKSAPDYEKLESLAPGAVEDDPEQLGLAESAVPENQGGVRPFDLSIRGAVSPRIEYDEPVVLARKKPGVDVIAEPETDEDLAADKERRRVELANSKAAMEAWLATPEGEGLEEFEEFERERRRTELETERKTIARDLELPAFLRR